MKDTKEEDHTATALTGFVDYNSACRPVLPQSGLRGCRGVRAVAWNSGRTARKGHSCEDSLAYASYSSKDIAIFKIIWQTSIIEFKVEFELL